MTSGSSPIRIADCRAGGRTFTLIRLASRWRSGAVPSGARCDSTVLLTPVRWPSTSGRSPRRPDQPMVRRWRLTRIQQGRTTDMSTR